jgi:hypothetical protein
LEGEMVHKRFLEDVGATFLCELDRAVNFEAIRSMRDGEDVREVLESDAEWLKKILPEYIDQEVEKMIRLCENGSIS